MRIVPAIIGIFRDMLDFVLGPGVLGLNRFLQSGDHWWPVAKGKAFSSGIQSGGLLSSGGAATDDGGDASITTCSSNGPKHSLSP
jgi:hypothetical protein